jgi:hypothetical protein
MSLSFNQFTDLSFPVFTFTFEYIDINDVHAVGQRISDDLWIPLNVVNRDPVANTVTITDNLELYSKVQVYRQTTTAPLVDFQNGARITEKDLDAAYRQGLFVAQEVAENANQSTQREDVDTDVIADFAVITPKLGNGAVTDQKLAATLNLTTHSVTLATGEIDTNEIADDAITNDKLDVDSVDSDQIVDGSVDNVHLAGGIDLTTKVTGILPAANGGTGVTGTPPFTIKAESSDVTIPAQGTAATFTHGLGQVPEFFKLYLKCTTAANGYSVGDLIDTIQDTNGNRSIAVSADATTISVNRAGDIHVADKDTGTNGAITTSNYSFIFKAYA